MTYENAAARVRAWRARNPGYNARWVDSATKWQIEHPDNVRQAKAKWRSNNIEQARELDRGSSTKWQAAHPDMKRANDARYRANKKGAPVKETVNRLVVADRDGWICQLCKSPIDPLLTYRDALTGRPNPWYLNIDHIVPISKGGEHSYANSQATHARCNVQKSDSITD